MIDKRHKCCICGEKRYERYMTSLRWSYKPTPLRVDCYVTWVCGRGFYYQGSRCLDRVKSMPEARINSPAGEVKGVET